MMDTVRYFSYGSYMDEAKMRRSVPEARLFGAGSIEHFRLVFTDYAEARGRAGADLRPESGGRVWGVVYELPTAALAVLDANKAYPTLYDRFQLTACQRDGKRLENVWTYALTKSGNARYPPPPDYLALLVHLARKHGFPGEYLRELEP